ncbi:hypothetical protein STCU_12128 [Strigomonas culicis]|uniref:Uncharacterized protein n=1 Tax=Strigomonas culicis TaxID=28005 RepID=S9TEC3_9TRYP|nr:hypothetical protein STCU_12128 [Strigomonas culicis]|eukprot:EPY15314.1 hypothetical protein STCU_12128 [Strigomonas culicis]
MTSSTAGRPMLSYTSPCGADSSNTSEKEKGYSSTGPVVPPRTRQTTSFVELLGYVTQGSQVAGFAFSLWLSGRMRQQTRTLSSVSDVFFVAMGRRLAKKKRISFFYYIKKIIILIVTRDVYIQIVIARRKRKGKDILASFPFHFSFTPVLEKIYIQKKKKNSNSFTFTAARPSRQR